MCSLYGCGWIKLEPEWVFNLWFNLPNVWKILPSHEEVDFIWKSVLSESKEIHDSLEIFSIYSSLKAHAMTD